jgi:hypothetical protein
MDRQGAGNTRVHDKRAGVSKVRLPVNGIGK